MHAFASLRAALARRFAKPILLFTLATLAAPAAYAEGRIRIAEQFGVVYLILNIAQDQKLIEKHGKKRGVDIQVEWTRLSGGASINDALLSGAIDIAGAGVGPLLTVWDRTQGRDDVKGVASLGNFPYYLVSTNPAVKSIADFSDKDRIALPAVTVSVQSRILQLAVAKQFGDREFARLDKHTQALPHPDATAALIAGKTEINAHFGTPPFSQQILAANPKAHIVLDSYEVLGGPASATVLYATSRYRRENPKTYAAFVDALAEAAELARNKPELAADSYLRVNGSKLDRELLLKVLRDPKVQFRIQPQNTLPLARFMHKVGAIKKQPASWRDYFFDDAAISPGS